MKEIEVMMQNLITLAFDTVVTLEEGVELLDIFMHLSYREARSQFFTNNNNNNPTNFLWRHYQSRTVLGRCTLMKSFEQYKQQNQKS